MMTRSSSGSRRKGVKTRSTDWVSLAIATVLISAIVLGWVWRDALPWVSERGFGYALGIAGVSLVGLLLVYPLRKRIAFLRAIGTVPVWFRLHMLAGALAPVLILYHARFQLGSINANVALFCMLMVGASGVVGRYLYVRIHQGITGRRREAREMIAEAESLRDQLGDGFREVSEIAEDLEQSLAARSSSLFGAIQRSVRESRRVNFSQRDMIRVVQNELAEHPGRHKGSERLVRRYCQTLRSAIQLEVFEKFFALWHVVHLPLFFLMVISVIVHIVAVHLY